MSSEENMQRLRRYLTAVDSGDESRVLTLIEELVAEGYVAHMAGSTLQGRDGLKAHVRGAFATFANMEHIVEDEFASGDKVVTRVRFRAVQKGEFLGRAPSGQKIECPIIYIHRFAEGRIQEAWLDWDALFVVAHQLGAA